MEREAGDSSSSRESYSDEGELYVGLSEGDKGRRGESTHPSWRAHVSGNGDGMSGEWGMEAFDVEESPFMMAGEGDVSAVEMTDSEILEQEELVDSIFVYSAPSHFPDILAARKSAFGSIFVRTSMRKRQTAAFERRTVPESQFSMIPWHLDSFERESDRMTAKSSLFRAFEKRGIAKEPSSPDSQWDVYPITKSALFSFYIQDRIHQTRNLTKVEERIANAPVQFLKFSHCWPSGSTWTGHWDGLGMAGTGTYVMPHDVCYFGKMQDGMCHDDDATLVYPNGFKALHCNYINGKLVDYHFQFPDKLDHEKENWSYCQYPDRRFWSEIQYGLKPGKLAQRAKDDPPRKIPDNCYDTGDSFYNPKTKMLIGMDGELLRVPTCEEERWIKAHCRKAFRDFTGFRPDLYENWYDNDQELIKALMSMKKMHEAGHITYEELYQFYADSGILSSCSPFMKGIKVNQPELEKSKDSSQNCPQIQIPYRLKKIYEGREYLKTVKPAPVPDVKKKPPKKYCGSKPKRKVSSEKISGKIKFSEGKGTAITSSSDISERFFKTKKYERSSDGGRSGRTPLTASSFGASTEISRESDSSLYRRKLALQIANSVISEMVNGIVLAERERHRDRFIRTQPLGNLPFGARDRKERCVQVLEELYRSIPEKEEFCDSVADRTCDLKNLAEDKFQTIRYWGKRIFTLNFDEEK